MDAIAKVSSPADRSLVAAHRRQVETRGSAPALRHRRKGVWHTLSWAQWEDQSRALAAALVSLGVEAGDHVAVLADTCVEWAVADLAIQMAGAITTPIYGASAAGQIAFLLQDCDVKLVFCENAQQLHKVASRRAELPALRRLLCFESAPDPWPPTLEPGFVRRAHASELAARAAAIGRE